MQLFLSCTCRCEASGGLPRSAVHSYLPAGRRLFRPAQGAVNSLDAGALPALSNCWRLRWRRRWRWRRWAGGRVRGCCSGIAVNEILADDTHRLSIRLVCLRQLLGLQRISEGMLRCTIGFRHNHIIYRSQLRYPRTEMLWRFRNTKLPLSNLNLDRTYSALTFCFSFFFIFFICGFVS